MSLLVETFQQIDLKLSSKNIIESRAWLRPKPLGWVETWLQQRELSRWDRPAWTRAQSHSSLSFTTLKRTRFSQGTTTISILKHIKRTIIRTPSSHHMQMPPRDLKLTQIDQLESFITSKEEVMKPTSTLQWTLTLKTASFSTTQLPSTLTSSGLGLKRSKIHILSDLFR